MKLIQIVLIYFQNYNLLIISIIQFLFISHIFGLPAMTIVLEYYNLNSKEKIFYVVSVWNHIR